MDIFQHFDSSDDFVVHSGFIGPHVWIMNSRNGFRFKTCRGSCWNVIKGSRKMFWPALHNLLIGVTWFTIHFVDAGHYGLRVLLTYKCLNGTECWPLVVVLKVLFHFIRSTGAVVVSVSFRLGLEYALKSASLIVVLLTFCCGLKLDDIVGVPGLMNVLSWLCFRFTNDRAQWLPLAGDVVRGVPRVLLANKYMEYEERVPGQEEDQRGPGGRLWKRTVKHINWTKSK